MSVKEQLRAFITKNFYVPDPAQLGDDASLLDRGIIDSTGVLELTMFLEETFKIQVGDDELVPENLDSIANLEGYIGRKLGST